MNQNIEKSIYIQSCVRTVYFTTCIHAPWTLMLQPSFCKPDRLLINSFNVTSGFILKISLDKNVNEGVE